MQLSACVTLEAMESGHTACGHGAWRSVFVAQHLVAERIEEALAAAGLPQLAWYDVLLTAASAPGKRLRMFEVAEGIVMSRSGLTRLVDRIESAGYLRRETCPSDRRGTQLALTEDGELLLERARPVYIAAIDEHFMRHLPDPNAVAAVLQPVVDALRAERQGCCGEAACAEAACAEAEAQGVAATPAVA